MELKKHHDLKENECLDKVKELINLSITVAPETDCGFDGCMESHHKLLHISYQRINKLS